MALNHSNLESQLHQNDSEEEEEDLVTLVLRNNTIHVYFSLLCKYSKLIREKYLIFDVKDHLSEDIQRFQQQSNVNDEHIILFMQYFNNTQIVITNDNYRDLYKLSEFFQVKTLLKSLNKYSSANDDDIEFNINVILDEF